MKFLFCTCKSRSLTESAQYYEVVVLEYVPYSACAWVAKLNVSFIKYDENWQVQKPSSADEGSKLPSGLFGEVKKTIFGLFS